MASGHPHAEVLGSPVGRYFWAGDLDPQQRRARELLLEHLLCARHCSLVTSLTSHTTFWGGHPHVHLGKLWRTQAKSLAPEQESL